MIAQNLNIEDFDYPLPENRIALYPAEPRDASLLLIGHRDGSLSKDTFRNLSHYLPEKSLLIFNETRVVHARLVFQKLTGAHIEIFCLGPAGNQEINQALSRPSPVSWKTLVGGAKRWKEGRLVLNFDTREGLQGKLYAEKISRDNEVFEIEFEWHPSHLSFAEVLEAAGQIPLPPYIHREATNEDEDRYQTVYARVKGSVAAPTAGLHFTDEVFQSLDKKEIELLRVLLHVGAGTFRPVETNDVRQHTMHEEEYVIEKQTIEYLLNHLHQPKTLVGTTTVRTMESLYLAGKRLLEGIDPVEAVHIGQWDAYQGPFPSTVDALKAVLHYLKTAQLENITGTTRLMIVPGFTFRFTDILITNFHLPRSTLLFLVAAFYGNNWKKAYQFALDQSFRFLSYGDACLFFRQSD
ncbi:MAG: S-adenosylmethionine:tRNA ribosyltransferase-isomerase [Bacteroidales bacterium]